MILWSSTLWWHRITLDLFLYSITTLEIIIRHFLFLCFCIIFSLVSDYSEDKMIRLMSLFSFNFDMKDISMQRIQDRIKKYLTPPTNCILLELISRIIQFSNFHLLRSTKSGFNPINSLKEFIFTLEKADILYSIDDFLRFFHRTFKGYSTLGTLLVKSILYSLFESFCVPAFISNKAINIPFSCNFLGEY